MHWPDHLHIRRGVALLIVLVTVVLLVPAVAMLSGLVATQLQHTEVRDASVLADDLLEQADLVIDQWLSEASADVVLLDDVQSPCVAILNDRIEIAPDQIVSVRITAWDQRGMPSPSSLRSGSILRTAVPKPVLRVIDQIQVEADPSIGLDQFVATLGPMFDQSGPSRIARRRAFPTHLESDPLVFRDESIAVDSLFHFPNEPSAVSLEDPPLGAYIATHNHTPHQINVNTAPLPLIEAALRMAGRGGLDVIQQARAQQKSVPLGDLPEIDTAHQRAPALVSTSDTWSFRVDVSTSDITKSWWLVYQQSSSRRSRNTFSSWECIQRLAITE
jgi:hypothetical protein